MTNNNNTINDETWLDIINGSKQTEPDNQEEVEANKIRGFLLDKCVEYIDPDDIEVTSEQDAKYAAERRQLLAILKNKKLIDPD